MILPEVLALFLRTSKKTRLLCMISDKKGLEHLSLLLIAKKVKHIVFSPGSRNAPLVATFPRYKEFECYSIVDERSAAFFALGIAQKTGETVVLSCTSGSAVLNYAPAIAEAYYQRISLLVLTADRPENLIDRGDGQTIRQRNIYKNYIKKSYQLTENLFTNDELDFYQQQISEAIDLTQYPDKGPVHINIPFDEPIYGQKEKENPQIIPLNTPTVNTNLLEGEFELFAEKWNSNQKIMLIIGQQKPDLELSLILDEVAKLNSVIVLTETTSNIYSEKFINCIDKTLASIKKNELDEFLPDLLISLNSNIVSKRIKSFLRTEKPYEHWHIDNANENLDTYFHLSRVIPIQAKSFFERILPLLKSNPSNYKQNWLKKKEKTEVLHAKFLDAAPYSDLQVFDEIIKHLPNGTNVQFANSTAVRYSQLFDFNKSLTIDSNRGTSGIDGSVSTAVGAAWVSKELSTLITGDLSFFYDSNALWNSYISPNLRIIVVNNSGGGIFRFIDGPGTLPELEKFFETKHERKAKSLAMEAGLEYFHADSAESLSKALSFFFAESKTARLLEVFTPNELNGEVLRNYFKSMA